MLAPLGESRDPVTLLRGLLEVLSKNFAVRNGVPAFAGMTLLRGKGGGG